MQAKSELYGSPATHPRNVSHLDAATNAVTKFGTWSTVPEPSAMGMSYIESQTVGDYIQFNFYGVGLWGYFYRSADSGQIKVYIDGVLKQTLDMYLTYSSRQIIWIAVGLDKIVAGKRAQHTCKIEVETKNPSSGGNKVKVDGFEIEEDPGALQVLAFLEQSVESVGTVGTYGDLIPDQDLTRHLGGASKRWLDLYIQSIFLNKVAVDPTTEGWLNYVGTLLKFKDDTAVRTVVTRDLTEALTNKTLGIGTVFGADPNFNEYQALAFRVENVAALPAAGNKGRLIFRTSDNTYWFDNGTAFVQAT